MILIGLLMAFRRRGGGIVVLRINIRYRYVTSRGLGGHWLPVIPCYIDSVSYYSRYKCVSCYLLECLFFLHAKAVYWLRAEIRSSYIHPMAIAILSSYIANYTNLIVYICINAHD